MLFFSASFARACGLGLLIVGAAGRAMAAPPVNDNFANATNVTGLPATATGTNLEATRQTGEPDPTGAAGVSTVWWKWTAPSSGFVEINTTGSDFDTTLAVFTGTGVGSLTVVKSNDDFNGTLQSRVKFPITSGTVYRVQVTGFGSDTGAVTLNFLARAAPVPAVLQRFTLTPGSADVTTSGVSLNYEIQFTAPDTLTRADFILSGPGGDTFSGMLFPASQSPVSGSPTGGVYRGDIRAPAHRAAGNWQVLVRLYDPDDTESGYGGVGFPALPSGSTTAITLVNSGTPDLNPPVITSAVFTPNPVDVTTGARTVTLTLNAQDDFGVDYFLVEFYGASGGQIPSLYVSSDDLLSGTVRQGIWRKTFTIPAYFVPQTFSLGYSVYDLSERSNLYDYDPDVMPVPPLQPSFVVRNSGPVDYNSPSLTSVVAAPLMLSGGSLPAPVSFSLQATDDVGVAEVLVRVQLADGNGYGEVNLTRTGGSAASGTWTGDLLVGPEYGAGSYEMAVALRDVTGKESSYGTLFFFYQPFPNGASSTLTITAGPPDAYATWRAQFPGLTGAAAAPGADPDGDGLPNAVEFLCGTHPTLHSRVGGPDPAAARAPVYSFTADFLRVDYRLSAANVALGSGNTLQLQPQFNLALASSWSPVMPQLISGDSYFAQVPRALRPRQFLRLAVLP